MNFMILARCVLSAANVKLGRLWLRDDMSVSSAAKLHQFSLGFIKLEEHLLHKQHDRNGGFLK